MKRWRVGAHVARRGGRFGRRRFAGADALLANGRKLLRATGPVVLIVDHGLAPSSADEAASWLTASERAGDFSPCAGVEGTQAASGYRGAAREARYRLMGEWCRRNKLNCALCRAHAGGSGRDVSAAAGARQRAGWAVGDARVSPFPVAGFEDCASRGPLLGIARATARLSRKPAANLDRGPDEQRSAVRPRHAAGAGRRSRDSACRRTVWPAPPRISRARAKRWNRRPMACLAERAVAPAKAASVAGNAQPACALRRAKSGCGRLARLLMSGFGRSLSAAVRKARASACRDPRRWPRGRRGPCTAVASSSAEDEATVPACCALCPKPERGRRQSGRLANVNRDLSGRLRSQRRIS